MTDTELLDKLNKIVTSTKASLNISHNEHKCNYETIPSFLEWLKVSKDEVGQELEDEMVKRDSIWHIEAYAHTPVGFYSSFHYSFEGALDKMLKIFKEENIGINN